jgi:DNA-binding transcriptional LysR family regulator
VGLRDGLKDLTLIHEDETHDAWRKWLAKAGLNDRDARRGTIIPDPNMRVQAIIDGQGLALFDELVSSEIERGLLVIPSPIRLSGFGYYLGVSKPATSRQQISAILTWLKQQASG